MDYITISDRIMSDVPNFDAKQKKKEDENKKTMITHKIF